MPPISVFIAYADTYIGGNVLKQFQNKPQLFSVHACCWDEHAVPRVENEARDALRSAGEHGGGAGTDNLASSVSPGPGRSQGTLPTMPPLEGADNGGAALDATSGALSPQTLQRTLPSVFWRKDTGEVRSALAQCDWVVVEQRQAQEVFDLLHALQQSPFERPKRLVLISNFMTWYATPPLENDDEEAGAEEEEEDEDEEGEEEPDAPYPPPPELPETLTPEAEEEADAEAETEVLTEDQYNRRIPHVKYFNWRDAEKAVAAAHRANGLPLDTFVVFAGLTYGEGEDALRPFFSEAWSGDAAAAAGAAGATLPIFGTGKQLIPTIHVRDLATFTRKLLRCPYNDLPNPGGRYLFATDGAPISWRSIARCINRMFGEQCRYADVPPDDFPLYNNVELFTVNLRVESETVAAVMQRDDAVEGEGLIAGPPVHRDSSSSSGGSTWAAEGGFRANMEKIALEYRAAHKITPLRVAVLGPPMAGKTYLATRLAAHYQVPHFALEDVVASYKAHLEHIRTSLERYRESLVNGEKRRRLEIKKRRLLRSGRNAGDAEEEGEDDEEDDAVAAAAAAAQGGGGNAAKPKNDDDDDAVEEREERDYDLTAAEEREAEELMLERFESSEQVERWRQEEAEMSRVLLMRVRQRAATPDGNPKRKANQAKKKLTKEQQRRKEEEELQLVKDTLKDLPFQDKAIALMVRWRLAQPDCTNQGYILDGLPQTVAQARLFFGTDELRVPATDEEALNPPVEAPTPPPLAGDDEEQEPPAPKELCSGSTMPRHVIVLEADENFLLDRIAALSEMAEGQQAPGAGSAAATNLDRFYENMAVFRREFLESDFSLVGFFECATTVPGEVTLGGETPQTQLITVQGTEPLVPPPPPESAYEEIPLTNTESAVRLFIGEPHNLGKTPLQLYRDELRGQKLQAEQRAAAAAAAEEQARQEHEAFNQESLARNEREKEMMEIKKRDWEEMERRKEPLRQYLMQSIVPLLSKGLVEVCARRPEDPVDYLAEWLLKHNPHDDIFSDL